MPYHIRLDLFLGEQILKKHYLHFLSVFEDDFHYSMKSVEQRPSADLYYPSHPIYRIQPPEILIYIFEDMKD